MKRLFVPILSIILVSAALLFSIGAKAAEEEEVKVAVLPWEVRASDELKYIEEALFDMLSSRISVEEHLIVIGESLIEEVFSKYTGKDLTDDLIREMGRELKVNYVLTGSLTFIGESLSIDAKVLKVEGEDSPIYSVSQGRGIDSLIPSLGRLVTDLNKRILKNEGLLVTAVSSGSTQSYTGSFATSSKPIVEEKEGDLVQPTVEDIEEDFIIETASTSKTFWKSKPFIMELKGIGIGDTDGDGRNEIVLIDRHNLWIYRNTVDGSELVKELKGRFEENLFVDVIDLNKNGVDEIYVTRLSNDRLDSYVLEYTNGEYTKISSKLRWFLRVLSLTEGEQILLGQRKGVGQVFFGNAKRLYWKENNLSEGEDIDLPSKFNIYGFIRLDIGDSEGESGILGFDSSDHLRLYSKAEGEKWKEVWKSLDPFGGTLNTVHKASTKHESLAYIKGRIIQKDLNGDGKKDVVVNRNIPSGLGRYVKGRKSYEKGEILNMLWTGEDLEENWKTRMIKGYIADFQIDDIDNDGIKDLIIAVVTDFKGFIKKPRSHIISYRLNAR